MSIDVASPSTKISTILPMETNENSKSTRFEKCIKKFNNLNIEQTGIERILPQNRTDLKGINMAMIWIGANIIIPAFATGTLGPAVFKLSLYDSFLTIFIFNLLGVLPVAAIACSGPASGLRTMVFSRYSWGHYGASIMSIINVIAAFGWAAINSITGAQTLRVVTNNTLPMPVGILLMGLITLIVSFVGYKWIHIYERYSWIPVFIAYCILAGVGAKHFTQLHMTSSNGTQLINNHCFKLSHILSFGTSCFGFSVSWSSFAADYNTYVPEHTSPLKVFLLTFFGNFLSTVPVQLLGAATYTGTYTNINWTHAYEINNVGGLLGASVSSLGLFGKFLLILFSLSTIACNIPNLYSLSLSAHVIGKFFKRIPCYAYTIIGTIIYILIAIVAADRFNETLTSFMDIISYWFSIFIVIILEEHVLFRRCSFKNYDFNDWNNEKNLPISIAALLAGLVGIAGIALGMAQHWYIGPIARIIAGDYDQHGGNVGFEIGFLFTALSFPILRLMELYLIKR